MLKLRAAEPEAFSVRRKDWRVAVELVARCFDVKRCSSVFSFSLEWRKAFDLLLEMKKKELRGDVISCSSAMSCIGRQRWHMAFHVLQQMCFQQIEANVFSFSSLIKEWQRSLKIMKEMDHRKVEANVVTFNAALNSAAFHWSLALALLGEMQKYVLEADAVTFSP